MLPGSLRLGKIAGVDISLHVSWVLIVILFTWTLATGWFAPHFVQDGYLIGAVSRAHLLRFLEIRFAYPARRPIHWIEMDRRVHGW